MHLVNFEDPVRPAKKTTADHYLKLPQEVRDLINDSLKVSDLIKLTLTSSASHQTQTLGSAKSARLVWYMGNGLLNKVSTAKRGEHLTTVLFQALLPRYPISRTSISISASPEFQSATTPLHLLSSRCSLLPSLLAT